MRQADHAGARRHALQRLERELPGDLCYHSVRHTRDDVLPVVRRLAAMKGIGEDQRQLLQTATAYHDIGFVERYASHEATSIRIAAATLPRFGFDPDQIRIVSGIIRATRLPQAPCTLLEEVMADADLDVLGRDDFFERNQALRAETAVYGQPVDEEEWYRRQIAFLRGHAYFTQSARALRDAMKQRNLRELQRRLRA